MYERTNFFLAGMVMNSAKTARQKVEGSTIGEFRAVADIGISFGGPNDKGGQKPAAGGKIFLKSRLL